MSTDLTAFAFQTAGIVLVALVFRLLASDGPARFMTYWAYAWFALGLALAILGLTRLLPVLAPNLRADWLYWPVLSAFCLLEYTFGFYLWAGCRLYARGLPVGRADGWRLAVPAAVAIVGPGIAPSFQSLFPFHAGLSGFFFLMAFLATAGLRPSSRLAFVGLKLTQLALGGLVLLFWWYAVTQEVRPNPGRDLYSLHFSSVYDGLVETLLAFGLVILATDEVRRELEENNRRLSELTEQLAVAARTDPLTGLLNRRAFDAMLADRAGGAFAGSVAVVDLNFLKKINDEHGHQAGDGAIQFVARALRSHFRITDPVFRLGGDEFLAVLEGGRSTELAGRMTAVDRALQMVRLPGVAGSVNVGIAWGMADFDSAENLADAVMRADAEMYRCKADRKGGT